MIGKNRVGVIAFALIAISLTIGSIVYYTISRESTASQAPSASMTTHIEANCEEHSCCALVSAEIREYDDHDFISEVTFIVSHVDGNYVSFNKVYVLRVNFNKNLDNGDIIRIYARYNTVPPIKAVLVENTNWQVVGEGEVLAQWNYYDLLITSLGTPRSSFDITLLPTTPSSNSIRIDYVKCVCIPSAPSPTWRRPSTGVPIKNYTFNLNYIIITDSSIDPANVYLDIVLRQKINNSITNGLISESMIEQSLVHVPSIGSANSYTSHVFPMPDRSFVGVDNMTISLDVEVTVKGKILGSSDWIVINKSFLNLRAFDAWWY